MHSFLALLEKPLQPLEPFQPVAHLREHPAFAHLAKPFDPFERFMESQLYRRAFVQQYGFSMVSSETLQALATLLSADKVLEVGAGSGYLSQALAAAGVDVFASDLGPEGGYGGETRPTYQRDHEGDALELPLEQFGTILLAWPSPPLSEAIPPRIAPGRRLIYLGEGWGGNAGSDAFFEELASSRWRFDGEASRALNANHLAFAGIRDSWHVFSRL